MNIVFWFLVIIVLLIIWVCICSIFRPFGRFLSRIFSDVNKALNEEDKKE